MNYFGCLLNNENDVVFMCEDPSMKAVEIYLNKISRHPLNEGLIKRSVIGPMEEFWNDNRQNILWRQISKTSGEVIGRLTDVQTGKILTTNKKQKT